MHGIEDGLKYYSKLEDQCGMDHSFTNLQKKFLPQKHQYILSADDHYCLTGRRLELSCVNSSATWKRLEEMLPSHDRYKNLDGGQGMLQEWNMNYKRALSNWP